VTIDVHQRCHQNASPSDRDSKVERAKYERDIINLATSNGNWFSEDQLLYKPQNYSKKTSSPSFLFIEEGRLFLSLSSVSFSMCRTYVGNVVLVYFSVHILYVRNVRMNVEEIL
jgi:hypothetical protein